MMYVVDQLKQCAQIYLQKAAGVGCVQGVHLFGPPVDLDPHIDLDPQLTWLVNDL